MFNKYLLWRESNSPTVTAKIKLQKNGSQEFNPLTVNRSVRTNLRILIRAFSISDKVGMGYKTIEKNKGETEPQMKRKSLWLAGGSARDHLKGKTPRNNNLVTDATPDEIRLILKFPENGFLEVSPKNEEKSLLKKHKDLPIAGQKNKIFYASKWDRNNKELGITAEINGEKFEISTLSKTLKSQNNVPDSVEFTSSLEDDAQGRDFTINALYIPLNQDDGENSEVIDPLGGIHHLKNNKLIPVGNLEDKLKQDPSIMARQLRFLGRFKDNLPEGMDKVFSSTIENISPSVMRSEFLNAIDHPDTDLNHYLGCCQNSGYLEKLFPGGNGKEIPENLAKDRWMVPAWIMRNSDRVAQALEQQGWSSQEAKDIDYLVKLYKWAKNNFDPNIFYDLKNTKSGLSKSKLLDWMKLHKNDGKQFQSFLNQNDDDIKPMIVKDGKKSVNPIYAKHLGRSPQRHEFENLRRYFSTKKFEDSLNPEKLDNQR